MHTRWADTEHRQIPGELSEPLALAGTGILALALVLVHGLSLARTL